MLICSGCGGVKSGGVYPTGGRAVRKQGGCRCVSGRTSTTPRDWQKGGVVEIVLLPVFEGVSMFVVCTRVCTIQNHDSLQTL